MVELKPLKPKDAVRFFEEKGLILTESWKDLWQEEHTKAFTVANIARMDVLCDIYALTKKAIANGTTLNDFKKGFKDMVKKRGWSGLPAWRVETIFSTNIQSAYMAGRYKQQIETKNTRPFWMYDAVNDSRTRPTHAAMDNRVFRADDPIWDSWYPPNGFNCRCRVITLSKEQAASRGAAVENSSNVKIKPDLGFDYNPAKGGFFEFNPTAENINLIEERLKSYKDYNLESAIIPQTQDIPKKLERLDDYKGSKESYIKLVKKALGIKKDNLIIKDPLGMGIMITEKLIKHLLIKKDGRERFIPYIIPAVKQPDEIWLKLFKKEKTGGYVWRRMYIKSFQNGKNRYSFVTIDIGRNGWVFWNAITASNLKNLNKNRKGLLLYKYGDSDSG